MGPAALAASAGVWLNTRQCSPADQVSGSSHAGTSNRSAAAGVFTCGVGSPALDISEDGLPRRRV